MNEYISVTHSPAASDIICPQNDDMSCWYNGNGMTLSARLLYSSLRDDVSVVSWYGGSPNIKIQSDV